MKDAPASSDREKWSTAVEIEIKSLRENDVWDLKELPSSRSPVGSKWVFTLHQRKLIQVYWLLRFRLGRRSG